MHFHFLYVWVLFNTDVPKSSEYEAIRWFLREEQTDMYDMEITEAFRALYHDNNTKIEPVRQHYICGKQIAEMKKCLGPTRLEDSVFHPEARNNIPGRGK